MLQLRQDRAIKRISERLGLQSELTSPDQDRSSQAGDMGEEGATGLTLPPEMANFAEPPVSIKNSANWSLDEDTLKALQVSSDDIFLPPEDKNNIEDEYLPHHSDAGISPKDFVDDLALWSESQRAQQLVETPAHRSNDHSELSEGQNPLSLSRGLVVWRGDSAGEKSTEIYKDQSGHSDTLLKGWALDQLQNKVNGAETWRGREINQRGEQGEFTTLKFIWPDKLSDNPIMWQFDAEIQARALQQIEHQAIPKVIDWGDHERSKSWYAVVEWVEGHSLAHHIKRGMMSIQDAVKIFHFLAEGLVHCHREGIIHRKIQPSHIILSPQGPRFISFQWVDEIGGQDLQRDQHGAYQLFGQRPKYFAPEWMRDARITDAADVYALGACLLEAVSPTAQNWRDAPPELQACLAGAFHEDPEARSTASEFALDLTRAQRSYLYQAGGENSEIQHLLLHEVVSKIIKQSLSWHLLAAVTDQAMLPSSSSLTPWGDYPEVVDAVERAQRYQPEQRSTPLPPESSLELKLEDLTQREEYLQRREQELKVQNEELQWRDEALRQKEKELIQRDVALQEEGHRLQQLLESLESREGEIESKTKALGDEFNTIAERLSQLDDQRHELEARSAELRVLEAEVERREAQREHELELKRAELEATLARLQEDKRVEEQAQLAEIEAAAERLLEERNAAEKARQVAREEALKLSEARQREAEQLRLSEREKYDLDLQEREAERLQTEDDEGAFARVNLRRPAIASRGAEPDEHTHREFSFEGVVMRTRFCPPGSTWCGADHDDARAEERPRHRVKLSKGFWLMETAVTQAQWSSLMDDNPSQYIGADHPVEGVTWLEAVLFCNALSSLVNLDAAYEIEGELNAPRHRIRVHWHENAEGFRLPTEAEWEYAARSGLSGQRHLYSGGEDLDEVAWYAQNSTGHTHAVGLKAPNRWGLFDLSGNIWEWCHDEWRRDTYRHRLSEKAIDPVNYQSQLTPRVIRGGAWYDYPSSCRLAARPGQDVEQPYGIGFRVCLPHSG